LRASYLNVMPAQLSLFSQPKNLPEGFLYEMKFLSADEEVRLVKIIETLPFRQFEFQGFLGKRRVVSFGWKYDFNDRELHRTEDMPDFLLPLRERAAKLAKLQASVLQQVLLTEYQPGAAIGWHKDKAVFGEVVGISLLSECIFRFRRKTGATWQRASLKMVPRSAYVLQGPARTEWEHSIPGVESLRYSITFRNLLSANKEAASSH
jgi:alkylated DNA repair dioxygenase AlkB